MRRDGTCGFEDEDAGWLLLWAPFGILVFFMLWNAACYYWKISLGAICAFMLIGAIGEGWERFTAWKARKTP